MQTPGLSPSALFSSVFFNQLAANLKNATNLLQQLKSENASLVVNTNGPREAPASVTQQAPVVLSSNALVAEVDQFAEPYSIHGVCLHGLLFWHGNIRGRLWPVTHLLHMHTNSHLLPGTESGENMLTRHACLAQRTTCPTWHRSSTCTRPCCRARLPDPEWHPQCHRGRRVHQRGEPASLTQTSWGLPVSMRKLLHSHAILQKCAMLRQLSKLCYLLLCV